MTASLDAENAFGKSKTHPRLGEGWHGRRDWSFKQVKDKRESASRIFVKMNPLLTNQVDKLRVGTKPVTTVTQSCAGIPATSCAHSRASRRRLENIVKESALSFYPKDAESWTQAIWLGDRHIYPVGHLASPRTWFLKAESEEEIETSLLAQCHGQPHRKFPKWYQRQNILRTN